MLKIVLFAFICLSSVANASSGFYISASSLTSKENASTKAAISASDVTYSENMAGLKTAQPKNNIYQFQPLSPPSAENIDFNNDYITKQIVFTLSRGSNKMSPAKTGDHPQITVNAASTTNPNYTYTINPIDYTSQIATVKSMVSSEVSGTTTTSKTTKTPNFTINNTGGFELSTGYKVQKEEGIFFIAPQIDYSSFGSNSSSLKTSALGIVTKLGASISKASIYGFGGLAFVSNSSNGSTQNIDGIKYGFGTEFHLNKRIALFAEVFQIVLKDNTQSVTYQYLASDSVRQYIQDNSNPAQVIIQNTTNQQYILTLNNIGLNNKIDPNSIKVTRQTSIESIQGFKVGLTFYFGDGVGDKY